MLSPYKLYKHDMKHQRTAVTWGPKGKPYPGCTGTTCYNHKHVDWTVHRLTPAVYDRAKPGGRVRKTIDKAARSEKGFQMSAHQRRHMKASLTKSSPRWGEGNAPSRRPRKVVPLPKHGEVDVSKKTYVAVGAVAAGAAGAYAYRRHKKKTAEQAQEHFQHSREYHRVR